MDLNTHDVVGIATSVMNVIATIFNVVWITKYLKARRR